MKYSIDVFYFQDNIQSNRWMSLMFLAKFLSSCVEARNQLRKELYIAQLRDLLYHPVYGLGHQETGFAAGSLGQLLSRAVNVCCYMGSITYGC